MKKIFNPYKILLAVLAFSFFSCDEDPTDALKEIIKEDKGYVPKIARFTMVAPSGTTTVAAGANLNFDLRYWSEGTIKDVQFWLINGTTETKLSEQAYTPAYSKITRTDSLIYAVQAPALASGTSFSIQARVANVGLEDYPTRAAVALRIQ
jgi:hypothetical protein